MNDVETYYDALTGLFLFVAAGIAFVLVMMAISKLIRPNKPNPEKLSTYESGEEPITSAWAQFNPRFYVVAIIFLLFEVEMLFLFPWATVYADKNLIEQTDGRWGWFSFIEMTLFIVVLVTGLAYAWVKGHLDWIIPHQEVKKFKSPVPEKLYSDFNSKFE